MNSTRLKPVPGFQNLRCLGGYQREDGAVTRWDHSFRSDWQPEVDQQSLVLLRNLGIRHVIDLRSPQEIDKTPNPLVHDAEVHYHLCPLMRELDPDAFYLSLEDRPDLLVTIYIDTVEHSQDQMRRVLTLLADHPDEAVLFHCSAGKDRTGMVAAMLLALAGISHEHIISDYAQSHQNILAMVNDRLAQLPENIPQDKRRAMETLFRSDAENMVAWLDYLEAQYGSVLHYVQHLGLSEAAIARLRQRMF